MDPKTGIPLHNPSNPSKCHSETEREPEEKKMKYSRLSVHQGGTEVPRTNSARESCGWNTVVPGRHIAQKIPGAKKTPGQKRHRGRQLGVWSLQEAPGSSPTLNDSEVGVTHL